VNANHSWKRSRGILRHRQIYLKVLVIGIRILNRPLEGYVIRHRQVGSPKRDQTKEEKSSREEWAMHFVENG
jgi:hypothetical protein